MVQAPTSALIHDSKDSLKNAAKRDSAGAVCNSGMGMLFFNVFYFRGIFKIFFFGRGGGLDEGK